MSINVREKIVVITYKQYVMQEHLSIMVEEKKLKIGKDGSIRSKKKLL